MTVRQIRVVMVGVVILGFLGGTALAGGSSIEPYRQSYRPGETVVMRGDVSAGQLGWVGDGPFYAYLRVDPHAGDGANRFPHIDESDVFLGELKITETGPTGVHVSLVFTLPTDIQDGVYSVVYCNDPCTEGLGDLIGGWVSVATPRWSYRPCRFFLFPI